MILRRALPFALALLLAGCNGGASDPKAAYQRGVDAMAKDNANLARVEFLNATKADPQSVPARLGLARAAIALGDAVAADNAIAAARKLGAKGKEVDLLAGETALLKGDAKAALSLAEGAADAGDAAGLRLRAEALQALGDGEAATAFDRALRANDKDPRLWLAVTRLRRGQGDIAGAAEAVQRAIQITPDSAAALMLAGELTRTQYGPAASIPWFDKAVAADPGYIPALLERAATHGEMGHTKAMLADTRQVLTIAAGNPRAYFLQAVLAARAGNHGLARTLLERTRGLYDDQPATMMLRASVDFQAGNYIQSADRLEALLQKLPGNAGARRLLAAAHWRRGDADATIKAIRPLADGRSADAYSLSLMGEALRKKGDSAARLYFERAERPQSAASSVEPVSAAQLAVLRRDADAAPADPAVQLQLIGALVGQGLGDEALRRATRLQARHPGVPDAHVLAGDARAIGGDFAGAAEEYRKAANLAFTEPTALKLIEALGNSNQDAAAANVMALFLQQNPASNAVRTLAANRAMTRQEWGTAIHHYEALRAREGNGDAILLNNLAWAYMEVGEPGRALPLARRAWLLDKDNGATADTYGWLLYNSGADRSLGMTMLLHAAARSRASGARPAASPAPQPGV